MIRAMVLLICLLCIATSPATAAHKHLEKEYQEVWCEQQGGELEVVLDDGARIDCQTATHAVEFDFGSKWAESIGQALYYGIKTGRTPGVVLILEQKSDKKFLERLNTVADELGIEVWTMRPGDLR